MTKQKAPNKAWRCVVNEINSWTYRLRVPGGWLYRHYSITLELVEPLTKERTPQAAVETMCFVPDPTYALERQSIELAPLVVKESTP